METRRPDPTTDAAPLLEARGLSKSFRGLQALVDYELRLAPLTIHGVIGPNGAGKTTLFHLLSGFLRPSSGTIAFEGRDITGSSAFKVSRLGIGRTFQNIRLFGELSVARQRQGRPPAPVAAVVRRRRSSRARRSGGASASWTPGRRSCSSCSAWPASAIGRRATCRTATSAGSRSRGPSAPGRSSCCSTSRTPGMNPIETQELLGLIRRLRDELGITIVLVAHDIPLVMNLCDRIQVLNYGRLIAEGDPAAVRANPDVIAAYLGQARHA